MSKWICEFQIFVHGVVSLVDRKIYKDTRIMGVFLHLWCFFCTFAETCSASRSHYMRKISKTASEMRCRRPCFAPELFAVNRTSWETGPHVRILSKMCKNLHFFHINEERRPPDHKMLMKFGSLHLFGGSDGGWSPGECVEDSKTTKNHQKSWKIMKTDQKNM